MRGISGGRAASGSRARAEGRTSPPAPPPAPGGGGDLGGWGGEREPRPGRGTDLYNLREYRWGDDPRLIHWKSTAKSGAVMVRELEAEAALSVRLVLEDPPPAGR